MPLQSQLFRGDPKLEACAVSDPAHILPNSRGAHVGKIQNALIQVDGASIVADSIYGPATVRAVRSFKESRGILNGQGQIDDITGKKTIAALDVEMVAVEQRGSGGGARGLLNFGITLPFVDVVVRFRAGTFRSARQNLNLTEYEKKKNRRLVAIDSRTEVGNASLILGVIKQIDAAFASPTEEAGIICINGNSAGGRNALELAAALRGKRPVKFLGIADAALFGNLPGMNRPIVVSFPIRTAINNPFWGSPPLSDAEIKHNFFQNIDNKVGGLNPLNQVWTSDSPIGEIHGQLAGFQVNEKISVPFGKRNEAHDFAGDEGDRRNSVTISNLLASL